MNICTINFYVYVHLISDALRLSVRVAFTFTKISFEHDIFTFKLKKKGRKVSRRQNISDLVKTKSLNMQKASM